MTGRHQVRQYDSAGKDEGERRLTVFYHIPKCGGCSVSNFLSKSFGDGHYGRVNYIHEWKGLVDSGFGERADRCLAVSGHASWGIHSLFQVPRDVFYFTMLREPFSLFLSTYNYARMNYCRVLDLWDFLDNYTVDNICVQYLGNNDIECAKDRLESTFFFFGLVEDYDESIAMLARSLNVDNIGFDLRNVSKHVAKSENVDQELREEFYARNRQDVELYEYAKRIFIRRKKETANTKDTGESAKGNINGKSFHEACSEAVQEYHAGNVENALNALIGHKDRSPAAYRALVNYSSELGRDLEALKWLTYGAEEHPDMLAELARFHERQGDRPRALTALDNALARINLTQLPDFPDASWSRSFMRLQLERARILLAMDSFPEALQAYKQAYRACPVAWLPLYEGRRAHNEEPLVSVFRPGYCVGTIRFGPMFSYKTLFDSLTSVPVGRIDHIVHANDDVSDYQSMPGDCFRLPPGRYNHDPKKLDHRIFERAYDAVVIVINLDNLEKFEQIFMLAGGMKTKRRYLFPMKNTMHDLDSRMVLPLDLELMASNAPEGTEHE